MVPNRWEVQPEVLNGMTLTRWVNDFLNYSKEYHYYLVRGSKIAFLLYSQLTIRRRHHHHLHVELSTKITSSKDTNYLL